MRVVGYHGTRLEVAEHLVKNPDDIFPSTKTGEWLGWGIYFFQDAQVRAITWARRDKCAKGGRAAVIRAEIDISQCLDFFDLGAFQTLLRYYPAFEAVSGGFPTQGELRVSNGFARPIVIVDDGDDFTLMKNRRDCAFLEAAIRMAGQDGASITTVRSPFLLGNAIYPSSFIFDDSHVQIAVRDRSAIVSPLEIVEAD